MNNNLNFQFGMYEPTTDSIIVNTGENAILVIRCKECNSSALFQIRIERKRIADNTPGQYGSMSKAEVEQIYKDEYGED